jgi:hypothetical protein
MPTKTSAGPNEVVRLEVLRLAPPLVRGSVRVRRAVCGVPCAVRRCIAHRALVQATRGKSGGRAFGFWRRASPPKRGGWGPRAREF